MLMAMASCAGPMGPFGASALPPKKVSIPPFESMNQRLPAGSFARENPAAISFYPDFQNFHMTSDIQVIIDDPAGVNLAGELIFLYGDDDVTELWQKYAKKEFDEAGKKLTLTMPKVRFLAGTDRKFMVAYRHSNERDYTIATLQKPICPIYELAAIRNPGAYKKSRALVSTIERESTKAGINPNLIAGLVAQESGYNPKAVSWAKAIGLTQVTDAAGSHVVTSLENAKSYEGIEKMSYPELMLKIYSGEINKNNEWRLNPTQSIQGGVEYINFLRSYWENEDSERQLTNVFDKKIPWEDIILASYNSGPYRVKSALQSHGKNWIYHPRLKEARKYISKVRSYCQSFAGTNKIIAKGGRHE